MNIICIYLYVCIGGTDQKHTKRRNIKAGGVKAPIVASVHLGFRIATGSTHSTLHWLVSLRITWRAFSTTRLIEKPPRLSMINHYWPLFLPLFLIHLKISIIMTHYPGSTYYDEAFLIHQSRSLCLPLNADCMADRAPPFMYHACIARPHVICLDEPTNYLGRRVADILHHKL